MKTPGAMGADIVVGEGQSIGVGLQFGGPHVGLFACRNDRNYIRNLPGRLAGETVDADGRRGFVLTLSTREQHIRRDKATSNICTNSGLMTLAWTIHMSLLGDTGLRTMAQLSHEKACELADRLSAISGVELVTDASSTSSPCACRKTRRTWWRRWPRRAFWAACPPAGSIRARAMTIC